MALVRRNHVHSFGTCNGNVMDHRHRGFLYEVVQCVTRFIYR